MTPPDFREGARDLICEILSHEHGVDIRCKVCEPLIAALAVAAYERGVEEAAKIADTAEAASDKNANECGSGKTHSEAAFIGAAAVARAIAREIRALAAPKG